MLRREATDKRAGRSAAHVRAADEVLLEEEVDTLIAVARLDLDAAMAYQAAAIAIDDEELAGVLRGMGDDHRDHIHDVLRLVEARGRTTAVLQPDGRQGAMASLIVSVSTLDPGAIIQALLANAQLTNATYDLAISVVSSGDALEVLTRGVADERRHLRSLVELASRPS